MTTDRRDMGRVRHAGAGAGDEQDLVRPDARRFTNATGNGANAWKNPRYGQLADAFAQGIALQPFFGNINIDNADLSGAKAAGVKILQYHGLADVLIRRRTRSTTTPGSPTSTAALRRRRPTTGCS